MPFRVRNRLLCLCHQLNHPVAVFSMTIAVLTRGLVHHGYKLLLFYLLVHVDLNLPYSEGSIFRESQKNSISWKLILCLLVL